MARCSAGFIIDASSAVRDSFVNPIGCDFAVRPYVIQAAAGVPVGFSTQIARRACDLPKAQDSQVHSRVVSDPAIQGDEAVLLVHLLARAATVA